MNNTNENENQNEIFETLMVGYYSKAIKVIDTKKGRRYMQNFNGRFLPLSKKNLAKQDLTEFSVYQELPGLGWIKIN